MRFFLLSQGNLPLAAQLLRTRNSNERLKVTKAEAFNVDPSRSLALRFNFCRLCYLRRGGAFNNFLINFFVGKRRGVRVLRNYGARAVFDIVSLGATLRECF